jgi:hypothetical protein
MITNSLDKLTSFLKRLEEARIHYTLEHNRDESIMVIAAVPGERWEIEFFPDGNLEIEVFRSDGSISSEDRLDSFLRTHCDAERAS